ncbi:MAG: bifunctional adenosylcobinamide kinase/adenosylcobinamide-phosphate guanylyltransferase [Sulfurimonas sp.]|nr:bifunctional adenosylcobinamide kinase/adenosylcobinamide-phosphate guanylyltransferase [Sulfurimonas sp.]PHQ92512.1 MAG: adenosylcobinamide kinase [Sulfurimonas sp.]
MQALFIGGIKSGKSKCAEEYVLKSTSTTPIYLATTEFIDEEMQEKIRQHKLQREEKFHTLEEPLDLLSSTKEYDSIILVECMSMWINNMLYHKYNEKEILIALQKLLASNKDFVFVINDVSTSVVSENPLTRKFVNINGKVSQILAAHCNDVFHVTAGISVKIK